MTTVMVVEDDPAFLTRFCGIVGSDSELELFAAVDDLASARQAISKAGPDVLLTDLGLPDGSGIDLIRETARRYSHTDIMVSKRLCVSLIAPMFQATRRSRRIGELPIGLRSKIGAPPPASRGCGAPELGLATQASHANRESR